MFHLPDVVDEWRYVDCVDLIEDRQVATTRHMEQSVNCQVLLLAVKGVQLTIKRHYAVTGAASHAMIIAQQRWRRN